MATHVDTDVAATILAQLGGRRFVTMTGARDLVAGREALEFRLPSGFAKDGVNKIRIVLTPMDTYVIETWRVRNGVSTLIDHCDDVYCDVLQDVFTRMTGLATRL